MDHPFLSGGHTCVALTARSGRGCELATRTNPHTHSEPLVFVLAEAFAQPHGIESEASKYSADVYRIACSLLSSRYLDLT